MINTIYQEPNYLKIESLRTPGEPEVFQYEEKGEKAYYMYYRRFAGRIGNKEYWSIIVPVRGNCGYVFNSDEPSKEFIKNFQMGFDEYAEQTGIVCEYTKLDWWNKIPNEILKNYYVCLHSKNYSIDLSGDFYKEEFNRKRRKVINDIIRDEYTIEYKNREFIDEFCELYRHTEEKFSIKPEYCCSKQYWEKCFEYFPNNCIFEVALKGNKAVTATLLMYSKDVLHATFTGSAVGPDDRKPDSLMDYEACIYGKMLGCKLFDLGNAPVGSSLELYKHSFVRKSGAADSFVATRINDAKAYQQLIAQNGRNLPGFFPEFRQDSH